MGELLTGSPLRPWRSEIRLRDSWAAWFDGLTLTISSDSTTTILGTVVDQAALHGLRQEVRDLGCPWSR
jgi:hypothetical protein